MIIEMGEWSFQSSSIGTGPGRMVRYWLIREKKGYIMKKEPYVQNLKVRLRTKHVRGILRKSLGWALDWITRNSGILKVLYEIAYFQG